MKGIIPAAGSGTRLLPITKFVNKTLLLAYNRPVIYYVLDTFVNSGITEVMIIVRSMEVEHFKQLLGDGKEFGLRELTITACDHTLGMPYSIRQAKQWVGDDSVMVVPGDNILLQSFQKEVSTFKSGAVVFRRTVTDPSRFGVPLYEKKKLIDLVEKPQKPQTKFALIAPYIFDSQVFDLIDNLRPSARGELEVIDLLKAYLVQSKLHIIPKSGFWKDVGTPDSLLEVGLYLRKHYRKPS